MNSRRHFLEAAAAGLASFGVGRMPLAARQAETQARDLTSPQVRSYRPLGATGLQVSDLGCGAIGLLNADVLRYAYDRGVNHFDTAEGYLNTNSEKYLGQALKDVRTKVIITTKHQIRSQADLDRATLVRRVEASLKRLQSDYLDIAMIHAVDQPEKLDSPELLEGYAQLKREGKVRFVGFSTHAPAVMLKAALANPLWQVVLLTYNHMEGAKAEDAVREARAKGLGLIAMKAFAGGLQGNLRSLAGDRMKYSHAAIRWVLGNPSIDSCLVSLSTFSHVDDYLAVSGTKLDRPDLKVLARYQREAGPLYCRVSCRECLGACPRGVPVNEILRYAMYYESYGRERSAMELYSALDPSLRASACGSCDGPCQGACPYGLAVRERLVRSHEILLA